MAEKDVVAAIISAVLTANQKTTPADVKAAVATYHACLTELQNYGAEPPESRWSAKAENARLSKANG